MPKLCPKNCGSQATFNFGGSSSAAYCRKHAEDGMINIRLKRCSYDYCMKHANYNFERAKGTAYCKRHTRDGVVNVRRRRQCVHDPCSKVPLFNAVGSTKADFCKSHARDGMVEVCYKTCSLPSCRKRATVDYTGKVAAYCKRHAEDSAVETNDTKCCVHAACTKTPIYNFEGEKTAAYCVHHTEQGMVYIWSHLCLHNSCPERPSFKFEGWEQGYCKLHADQSKVVVSGDGSGVVSEAGLGVTTDDGPNAFVGVKREKSDNPVTPVDVEEVCETADCFKLSRPGIDGKEPTNCPNDAPLEEELVEQCMEPADTNGCVYTTPSVVPRTDPIDDGRHSGRNPAKRTRNRLYRRPL